MRIPYQVLSNMHIGESYSIDKQLLVASDSALLTIDVKTRDISFVRWYIFFVKKISVKTATSRFNILTTSCGYVKLSL